jgi:hypothetical protein
MKKFKFLGHSFTSFTLNENKVKVDYILISGEVYDLPSENAHIQSLVGNGYLVEVQKEKSLTAKQK